MFFILFFLILQFLFGLVLIKFFDGKSRLHLFEEIVSSVIVGMTLGSLVILIFAILQKNLLLGIISGSILELAFISGQYKFLKDFFVGVYASIKNRNFNKSQSFNFIVGVLLVILVVAVWLAVASGILINDNDQIKSILIGWGDSAYHLSMIRWLAEASPFEVTQPIFSGAPLTYPFLINFAGAILLKLGVGVLFAFYLPLIILGICGIILFFLIARKFFKSNYWAFAVLILIILGSGLGFWQFFKDIKSIWDSSPHPIIETLINPPHDYTHLDNRTGGKPQAFDSTQNIVWITPAISFLSHQRSFVWGFALLAVLILLLWLYKDDLSIWKMGILAGALPLIHGHTFLALAIAGLGWLVFSLIKNKNWKGWILFGVISALVAAPSLMFLNQGMHFWGQGTGSSFFRLQFGWMMCDHSQSSWLKCTPEIGTDSNILAFWSKNFGINFWLWAAFVMIAISGAKKFFQKKNSELWNFLEWILIPSVFIFIIFNLFIFQPWEFDNNKVIFSWWILAAFISVGFLYYFYYFAHIFKGGKIKYLAAAISFFAVFLGIFAGILDVEARVFNFKKNHYGYSDEAQLKLAEWIKKSAPANAVFLTGNSPTTSALLLGGRQIYLGYTGWLWTQGVNYLPREQNIKEILQNHNLNLACSEKIDYIILDGNLTSSYVFADVDFLKKLNIVYQDEKSNIFVIKINCEHAR